MNLLFNLPDELIDIVLSFWNPYKIYYEISVFEIKKNYFWFRFFSFFFPRRDADFYKYILRRNIE
tara:strand:+ start:355 stop:549 length:195 start_codon:yes stop_codon:yes gene_type:complete